MSLYEFIITICGLTFLHFFINNFDFITILSFPWWVSFFYLVSRIFVSLAQFVELFVYIIFVCVTAKNA